MGWLLLVGLGIMWGALLLPASKAREASRYERTLELLADVRDGANRPGRWVMIPRQDSRFIGRRGRARARLLERRRRVLSVLGETIAFTFLIGAFPPLRTMWVLTGVLVAMLAIYIWMLIRLRANRQAEAPPVRAAMVLPETGPVVVRRHAAGPRLVEEHHEPLGAAAR